jgi:hypothetical protein
LSSRISLKKTHFRPALLPQWEMGKRYILLVSQRRDGYDYYNRSQSGWLRPDSMAKPTATRINCDIDIVLICFCTYVTSSGFTFFVIIIFRVEGRWYNLEWMYGQVGAESDWMFLRERFFPADRYAPVPMLNAYQIKWITQSKSKETDLWRHLEKKMKTAFCYTQKWIYKYYWCRISMTQYLKFIKRRYVIISWFSLPFACRSETWRKKKEKRREYIFTDYYLTSPSAATGQSKKLKKRNSIS